MRWYTEQTGAHHARGRDPGERPCARPDAGRAPACRPRTTSRSAAGSPSAAPRTCPSPGGGSAAARPPAGRPPAAASSGPRPGHGRGRARPAAARRATASRSAPRGWLAPAAAWPCRGRPRRTSWTIGTAPGQPRPPDVPPVDPPRRKGAPAGVRTQTGSLLRRLPLPVGIRGRWTSFESVARPGSYDVTAARRGPAEDVVEHGGGEAAGEGVLLAGVVAAEQQHGAVAAGRRGRPTRRGRTSGAAAVRRTRRRPGRRGPRPSRTRPARRPPAATARPAGSPGGSRAGRCLARPVVGLLSGGAHRTVATIRAPTSRWPSPACSLVAWTASPTRCSDANSQSPDESPVNTRPVRLPPLAAGARPTIEHRRLRVAPARDRPAPVGLVRERRPLDLRDLLAPRDQPRAGRADRHSRVQLGELVGRGQPAYVVRAVRDRGLPRRRVVGPAGAGWYGRGERLADQGVGQERHTIDHAMPSRMSASDATSVGG